MSGITGPFTLAAVGGEVLEQDRDALSASYATREEAAKVAQGIQLKSGRVLVFGYVFVLNRRARIAVG